MAPPGARMRRSPVPLGAGLQRVDRAVTDSRNVAVSSGYTTPGEGLQASLRGTRDRDCSTQSNDTITCGKNFDSHIGAGVRLRYQATLPSVWAIGSQLPRTLVPRRSASHTEVLGGTMFASKRSLFGSENGSVKAWLAGVTSVALLIGTVALPAVAEDDTLEPQLEQLDVRRSPRSPTRSPRRPSPRSRTRESEATEPEVTSTRGPRRPNPRSQTRGPRLPNRTLLLKARPKRSSHPPLSLRMTCDPRRRPSSTSRWRQSLRTAHPPMARRPITRAPPERRRRLS